MKSHKLIFKTEKTAFETEVVIEIQHHDDLDKSRYVKVSCPEGVEFSELLDLLLKYSDMVKTI